ncbi:MAG: 2Fe-2S iron-sulfur cluster-binding protein [Anaerolineae bacterium]
MPTITVQGEKSLDASADQRLVLALEDNGIDILHRCGGWAKCTTCRVEFHEGEPEAMTKAEAKKLVKEGLYGDVRLSCQILCDHDMTVTPVYRLSEMDNMDSPGDRPADTIRPEPVEWVAAADAERIAAEENDEDA